MKKSSLLRTPALVLASLLVLFSLMAGAVLVPVAGAQPGGFWITGDLHTHTYLTDGSHTEAEVVSKAFNTYGLSWMANSEHGGAFGRNPEGANWDTTGATLLGDPNASKDSAGVAHPNMWRWQSLRDISFPLIAGLQAQYGNRRLFQSLEWNVPSHEHASVGIAEQGDGIQISNFEYTYDQNDLDTSRSAELPKINAKHKDAVAAAAFLQKTFPQSSYIILNHPSRKQAYTAADIRDLINAGPTVVMGLEGFPGHQQEPARGGYSSVYYLDAAKKVVDSAKTNRARTYGGADYMLAKVGGLMDSLWGEGRRFWVFVNSDFHSAAYGADFWPGEYAKTYSFAQDLSQTGIVNSLRSGDVFIAQGDLINALDFNVAAGGQASTMGQELAVKSGTAPVVTIRFKSPATNNSGAAVAVNHIDLIMGSVYGQAKPGTAAYRSEVNATTRVIKTFTASDWKIDADGYQTVTFTLPKLYAGQYLRLRGTNLGANVANETRGGDPLNDDLVGQNNIAKAYADLWFYSNPIFISVK